MLGSTFYNNIIYSKLDQTDRQKHEIEYLEQNYLIP